MGFDTSPNNTGQNGHVYDFSKLEKDVVTTIRHLSQTREQVNDDIKLPYTMDSGS
jgi:hypothetical protein